MGRVLESCARNLSCAMQFVPDPRIIGREEDVKVFRPRAIRWERSVQFGLEDRQRDQQQETSSEANGEQKPAGSGGQTEGTLPCGWPCTPPHKPPNASRLLPTRSALLSASTPNRSPCTKTWVFSTSSALPAPTSSHFQATSSNTG